MDIIFNAHEQTAYGAAQAKAEDKARAAEFAALSNPLRLARRAFDNDGKTVLAVLTVIFGVLVVASPFALVDLMFSIAGFGLVFNGVTELVAAFRM